MNPCDLQNGPAKHKPHGHPSLKEHALNNLIAATLRGGMIVSASLVLTGYIEILSRGIPTRRYQHFTGKPTAGHWGVLDALMNLRARHSPEDIITVGLLVLILTPVVRVIMSLIVFLYEGDKLYAALTAIVVGVLLFSLSVGSW